MIIWTIFDQRIILELLNFFEKKIFEKIRILEFVLVQIEFRVKNWITKFHYEIFKWFCIYSNLRQVWACPYI